MLVGERTSTLHRMAIARELVNFAAVGHGVVERDLLRVRESEQVIPSRATDEYDANLVYSDVLHGDKDGFTSKASIRATRVIHEVLETHHQRREGPTPFYKAAATWSARVAVVDVQLVLSGRTRMGSCRRRRAIAVRSCARLRAHSQGQPKRQCALCRVPHPPAHK
jgi:hypothetical protein